MRYNKYMKKNIFILILLATFLLTFGCGGGGMEGGLATGNSKYARASAYDDFSYSTAQWEGTGFNPEEIARFEMQAPETALRDTSNLYGKMTQETPMPNSSDSISANLNEVERKLVKSADVRIRVENLETADVSISSLMEKYDAYAASTNITENSYYYSLRVPSKVYDLFLAEMNGMGRMIHRSENTEDVTLRYYDLEGRLETKKELLRTFQSYLRRANNVDEILKVETRIAELQYDIERTGQELRYLANRVDYATIELNLLGPAAAASNRNVTFGERIGQMFGGFGGFLSSVAIVIVGIIIYGIPILLLVVFFVWLLFGRIGLIKKLWQLVKGKQQGT